MAVGALLLFRSTSSLARLFATSAKRAPLQERKLVDRFRLSIRGGPGGSGCTSFRKSRHSRHGTADGGNGGRGGDVILVSSAAEWDFSNLQHHLNGKKGGQGSSKRRVGSRGADKVVQVPVGTVVHLVSGSVPSLEQPPVTPDPVATDEESSDISAAWLDNLFLDNAKARLLAKNSQLATDSSDPQDEACDERRAALTSPSSENSIAAAEEEEHVSHEQLLRSSDEGEAPLSSPSNDSSVAADEEGVSHEQVLLHSSDEGEEEETDEEDDDEVEEARRRNSSRRNSITRYAVAEFVRPGQSLIMGAGGEGGRGNASMARGVGKTKSLPSLEHEEGSPGSQAMLVLELKTIADVGLVGAPNAGKSTLLGAMSRAKPTVGHYAFTTLRPNIGKLEYDDHFALTVADIPGLISGAHQNRGLGHAFLRHIERTKALAYVVDLAAGLGDRPGPVAWDQLEELKVELEMYQSGLSSRPALVVANKIDEPGTEVALEELRKRVGDAMPVFPVCAVLEEGVDELRVGLRMLVDEKKGTTVARNSNTASRMRCRPSRI